MNQYFPLLFILVLIFHSCRKGDFEVNPTHVLIDTGSGIGDVTLKSGHSYVIDGLVFVNEGQTLIIESGVVIRAKTGQGVNASALIVARGGKIFANGTKQKPIIFTAEGDDLQGSIPLKNKGLWGGLLILGHAPVNNFNEEAFIEGIPENEPRGVFGGNVIDDNSGVLRYISIRHGGTNIGQGNEINGLTLGGVGSATVVEYIEVLSNLDDGIEIFGGTVNLKNIVVAFCGDDAIDCDMGYTGNIQYILAIQDIGSGDKLFEADEMNLSFPPYLKPTIANATFIGRGYPISAKLMTFDGSGGASMYNSVFINQRDGIYIKNSGESSSSFSRFKSGQFEIRGNAFFNVANNVDSLIFRSSGNAIDVSDQIFLRNYFTEKGNIFANPDFDMDDRQLNPIPRQPINSAVPLNDPWFETTTFLGAFGTENWAQGWTAISKYGYLK
jgi:hypothetical protein